MSTSIGDYYAEKCVLITGATGFVGKLLIEKLLSSCDRISKIYCLIREKNGHSAEERLNEITSCKVYDKLRKKEPNFRERLCPISGNILESSLSIKPDDLSELVRNVSVVFHLAGTVNLDQDLKTSLLTNVLGLRRVLQFSKTLKKLDVITSHDFFSMFLLSLKLIIFKIIFFCFKRHLFTFPQYMQIVTSHSSRKKFIRRPLSHKKSSISSSGWKTSGFRWQPKSSSKTNRTHSPTRNGWRRRCSNRKAKTCPSFSLGPQQSAPRGKSHFRYDLDLL